jgi:hypothetical protein
MTLISEAEVRGNVSYPHIRLPQQVGGSGNLQPSGKPADRNTEMSPEDPREINGVHACVSGESANGPSRGQVRRALANIGQPAWNAVNLRLTSRELAEQNPATLLARTESVSRGQLRSYPERSAKYSWLAPPIPLIRL